jgi:hypothetical protein
LISDYMWDDGKISFPKNRRLDRTCEPPVSDSGGPPNARRAIEPLPQAQRSIVERVRWEGSCWVQNA